MHKKRVLKKEFRLAKSWRIIFLVFFSACSIGMTIALYYGLLDTTDWPTRIGYILAFITGQALAWFIVRFSNKNKVVVDDHQVHYFGAFAERTLSINEIKGFRVDPHYLYFLPVDKPLKKIQVSTYFGNFGELVHWARTHCKDLDSEQFIEDQMEILTDDNFGDDAEERSTALKRAKAFTKVFNTLAAIVGFGTMFFPYYYQVAILSCVAFPLAAMAVTRLSKGLIKLNERRGSAYPSIMTSVLFPPLGLAIRAISDVTVIDYQNFWIPAAIVFLVMALLLITDKTAQLNFSKPMGYFGVLGILIISAVYASATIVTTNMVFDSSETDWYESAVVDKRVSSGKTTSYYLKLAPWSLQNDTDDVMVDRGAYDYYEPGDTASIFVRQGAYGISYFGIYW